MSKVIWLDNKKGFVVKSTITEAFIEATFSNLVPTFHIVVVPFSGKKIFLKSCSDEDEAIRLLEKLSNNI